METIIEQFRTWLFANCKAKNTIKSYCLDMADFIHDTKIKSTGDLNEKLIYEYFASIKEKISQATYNHKISSLKSFLDFQNIFVRVPKTKEPMLKEVQVLEESDFINKVLKIVDYEFPNAIQVKAFLCFLYYVGLRVEDSTKVKRCQFNFNDNSLTAIVSKQNMEKRFILSTKVKDILIKYFTSQAEEGSAFNLTLNQVSYIFEVLRYNLPELKLHPHKFRKSFATNASNMGMYLEEIQDMMGHKNSKTTSLYVKKNQNVIKSKFLQLEAEQIRKDKKKLKENII